MPNDKEVRSVWQTNHCCKPHTKNWPLIQHKIAVLLSTSSNILLPEKLSKLVKWLLLGKLARSLANCLIFQWQRHIVRRRRSCCAKVRSDSRFSGSELRSGSTDGERSAQYGRGQECPVRTAQYGRGQECPVRTGTGVPSTDGDRSAQYGRGQECPIEIWRSTTAVVLK
jgi:hypothetical protein